MNMEIIHQPKFMPQFYTAPNARLRFKNAYNYVFAISYSIAHCGKYSVINSSFCYRGLDIQ
jgi:hypothetical protein